MEPWLFADGNQGCTLSQVNSPAVPGGGEGGQKTISSCVIDGYADISISRSKDGERDPQSPRPDDSASYLGKIQTESHHVPAAHSALAQLPPERVSRLTNARYPVARISSPSSAAYSCPTHAPTSPCSSPARADGVISRAS